ncbi:MAG: argininosuccinate lyase [Treponemataceae bacterium]|nr:argininosuccinate lyase [Treponemataceae bacterium]
MEHGTITSDNHAALWHGRFAEGPDAQAVAFETSIHVDERMALDDIRGSRAHARMLGSAGIISAAEADEIVRGLDSIEADLRSGALRIDTSAEDIHSFIEAVLTDRIGEPGRKVHTGRSRNDQIALDERLYLCRYVPDVQNRILTLIAALAEIAEAHTADIMPGYTHMQHAQPVTLAHHLCAWAWMLCRDWERLEDALKRIRISPIGAGALAGSGLPLNRRHEAELLGFSEITMNSLDSVSDRDYCIEVAAALSLVQMHLSRFCEEVVLWSTSEFAFIELSERWSTGSSIMPQKKNPDFAELVRGRTGRVYGDLVALLTMMKGLPLAYDRDMQEDKASLFDACDIVLSCVQVFTKMISTASWNVEKMAAECRDGFLNATDVADYLVRKGMPFRTAHGVSARAVRRAIEKGCRLEDLPLEDFRACSELIGGDIYGVITPEACVNARRTDGGPAAEKVLEQIAALKTYAARAKQIV